MRYSFVKGREAEVQWTPGGETTTFLATASDTDRRVSVFDSRLPEGNLAPWHYHELDDEIFYVIAGRVEFGVADEVFVATAGDLVVAGPLVPRRFVALEESRLLVINAPAGPSEGFLRDVMSLDAPPSPEDERRFVEKYGVHLGKPRSAD